MTVYEQDLRVGIFVCECGGNISNTVDCDAVVDRAARLDGVVFADKNRYSCAEPGQAQIRTAVKEHKLNRVVVAACTPRMHETTFRICIEEAGLNPYLFEMANIREHCSWVHPDVREATGKAVDLVAGAVAKARQLVAKTELEVPVTRAALVVGGGIAGIQASLDLSGAGYPVYLVEKLPSIGGTMAQLNKTYPTMD